MIVYTEKGAGLHQAISAAGHSLREHNGVWEADDPVAVQAIIDGYTLDQVKADVCTEIEARGAELRKKITAGVASPEMASWSIKRAEAYAYQASGNAADAPMLGIEASTRGIALADVAARVIANAGRLAALEATIAGVAGKHKDAVKNTTTFTAALAYNWRTGWPV